MNLQLKRRLSRKSLGRKIEGLRKKKGYAFLIDMDYLLVRYLVRKGNEKS